MRSLPERFYRPASLALATVALACGVSGAPTPIVVNATQTSLHVLAVGADAATRYDPAMALRLEPGDDRVLEPGASRSLGESDISEHRGGEGLVLFLYGVTGREAQFLGTRAVAAGAIADTIILAELPERAARAGGGALPAEQRSFWSALESLCGRALEGEVREAPVGDGTFAGRRLVMHVRECGPREIRIPSPDAHTASLIAAAATNVLTRPRPGAPAEADRGR